MSSIMVSANEKMPLKDDGTMYKYRSSHYRRLFYGDNLKEIANSIKEASKTPPKWFYPQELNDDNEYETIERYGFNINTLEPKMQSNKPKEKSKRKYYATCNGEDVFANTIKDLVCNAERICSLNTTICPMTYNTTNESYSDKALNKNLMINIDDKIIKKGKYYKILFTTGKAASCHVLGVSKLSRCKVDHNVSYNDGGDIFILETKKGIAIISKYTISAVKEISEIEWIEQ